MEDMLRQEIPLRLYTDSKCFFDVVTRGSVTAKRLQIDIALAKEAFVKNWLPDIALVSSSKHFADSVTKDDHQAWGRIVDN
jgi:hypothetical protein